MTSSTSVVLSEVGADEGEEILLGRGEGEVELLSVKGEEEGVCPGETFGVLS